MAQDVPTFDKLMWPTLKALKAIGGSGTNSEILEKVIELEGFPDEVQNFIQAGDRRTKLSYRLAWTRTYLGIVGALDNSERGVWAITKQGEALTQEEMAGIPKKSRRISRNLRRSQVGEAEEGPEDVQGDTENWESELFETLASMDPSGFERLCQRLLRESGFIKVEVTG